MLRAGFHQGHERSVEVAAASQVFLRELEFQASCLEHGGERSDQQGIAARSHCQRLSEKCCQQTRVY